MNIEQALQAAMEARFSIGEPKSPVESRRGREARMRGMEAAFGGRAKAAAAVGVSRSAWERWWSGKQKPTAASLRKLADAYRRHLQEQKARLSKKATTVKVTVSADIEWGNKKRGSLHYNPQRHRTVKFGAMDMGPVLRAWLSGQSLTPAFEGVVRDAMQADVMFHGDDAEVNLT